jgi:hypothetical protein
MLLLLQLAKPNGQQYSATGTSGTARDLNQLGAPLQLKWNHHFLAKPSAISQPFSAHSWPPQNQALLLFVRIVFTFSADSRCGPQNQSEPQLSTIPATNFSLLTIQLLSAENRIIRRTKTIL